MFDSDQAVAESTADTLPSPDISNVTLQREKRLRRLEIRYQSLSHLDLYIAYQGMGKFLSAHERSKPIIRTHPHIDTYYHTQHCSHAP